ncbi:hypothetical protein BOTBODRAFT_36622 [Botryobasidium botryosum FD-172 SS1]|uniref:Cytochrome P450 n=1 Tax=Botryobasidium botryosum (strain FD-172 SS1) TaxID=930990 RepID=A0A067M2K2_BOTB1|nr:hypothetical protein BOTBODRAFT_36622 [Botryobasidium botryosum FD-172 SS1]
MFHLPDSCLVALCGLSILAFTLVLYIRYQNAIALINGFPGIRTVFDPFSAPGVLTSRIPGLSIPHMYKWEQKYKLYQETGWDIYSGITIWPKLSVSFSVADASAIKEIVQNKATFPKPAFALLALYGPNVVTASNNEEAKRHKKVAAPAFSERNNKLVWRETSRIIEEIFAHWGSKDIVPVDHIVDITLPLALHVISAAGFGRPIPWRGDVGLGAQDGAIPVGHPMSYQEAIETVCKGIFTKLLVPSWAMGLTKRWKKVAMAFDELGKYMSEMIESRRDEGDRIKTDEDGELYKSDLFSNLLSASDAELVSEKGALSERELMGNIFVFLLAGHETTAHSLALAMGLLACYPEEQQKLRDHIKSVLPDGRLPEYEDIPLLTRSLAVFYEATRLFPVPSIAKTAVCDTTLTINASIPPGADIVDGKFDQQKVVFVPNGAFVMLDVFGLHYNPRHWKDPNHFNPERFMSADWNRDAFMTFSAGSRACLGRRFSEIEAVTALTMITMRYKIELNGDLFHIIHGETPRATRERLLKVTQGITLAPVRLPLLFRKRD